MDPLSITASIAGLISLANELFPLLVTFVQDVRSYPKDFTALLQEARSICGVLSFIKPIIEKATHNRGT